MNQEKNEDIEKRTDYDEILKEFGISRIESIEDRLPKDHLFFQRRVVFAHRDFDKLLDMSQKNEKWAIISGRGPSNDLHLGHLLVFELIKYLQEKFDCDFFMPLSNDEKYVFRKVKTIEETYKLALENAIDIFAIGFKPEMVHAYISSESHNIYKLALNFSVNLTYNSVKAALGLSGEENIGMPFYSAIQGAHIMQPTVEYGYPVLVPIGLDQDVYMRLTRDIARKRNIFPPASIYVKYLKGITGTPMSSSKPETCIFLRDTKKVVRKKIMNAFTGGRATIKEQRELGGIPEVCTIFDWFKKFFVKDDKELKEIYSKCKNGEYICGIDCKPKLIEYIYKYQEKHKDRRKNVEKNIEKYFEHEIDLSLLDPKESEQT